MPPVSVPTVIINNKFSVRVPSKSSCSLLKKNHLVPLFVCISVRYGRRRRQLMTHDRSRLLRATPWDPRMLPSFSKRQHTGAARQIRGGVQLQPTWHAERTRGRHRPRQTAAAGKPPRLTPSRDRDRLTLPVASRAVIVINKAVIVIKSTSTVTCYP